MLILAGLHVMGHYFSDESPFSGDGGIHKISVNDLITDTMSVSICMD